MREIQVRFKGGPLDGMTRRTEVPDHWRVLRVEERKAGRYHVYAAPLDGHARSVRLDYRGCETVEVPECYRDQIDFETDPEADPTDVDRELARFLLNFTRSLDERSAGEAIDEPTGHQKETEERDGV